MLGLDLFGHYLLFSLMHELEPLVNHKLRLAVRHNEKTITIPMKRNFHWMGLVITAEAAPTGQFNIDLFQQEHTTSNFRISRKSVRNNGYV